MTEAQMTPQSELTVVETIASFVAAPLYGHIGTSKVLHTNESGLYQTSPSGLGTGLFIRRFFGAVTHIEGPSMLPTVREKGDYVMYEKISVVLKRIKVGDVVICR